MQFMGHTKVRKDLDAESREADESRDRGLDKQEVASDLTMNASDPPSTNMGGADKEMTP